MTVQGCRGRTLGGSQCQEAADSREKRQLHFIATQPREQHGARLAAPGQRALAHCVPALRGHAAHARRPHAQLLDPGHHARPGRRHRRLHEPQLPRGGEHVQPVGRAPRPGVAGGHPRRVAQHAAAPSGAGGAHGLARRAGHPANRRLQRHLRHAPRRTHARGGGRGAEPRAARAARHRVARGRVRALRRGRVPQRAGAVGGAALPRPGPGPGAAAGARRPAARPRPAPHRHRLHRRRLAEAVGARGLRPAGAPALGRVPRRRREAHLPRPAVRGLPAQGQVRRVKKQSGFATLVDVAPVAKMTSCPPT